MSKKQDKFQILKSLEQDSYFTQRQLSNNLGVSLGKVNYCVKSLIEKGFIKVDNFRNSDNKNPILILTNPKRNRRKSKADFRFYKNQNSRIRHTETRN